MRAKKIRPNVLLVTGGGWQREMAMPAEHKNIIHIPLLVKTPPPTRTSETFFPNPSNRVVQLSFGYTTEKIRGMQVYREI